MDGALLERGSHVTAFDNEDLQKSFLEYRNIQFLTKVYCTT